MLNRGIYAHILIRMDRREALTSRQGASGYIIHDALDGRHRGTGNALSAPEAVCDGGDGVRPQGGGGVDHLAKVQQRKAQTDTLFSLSHSLPIFANSCKTFKSVEYCKVLESFSETPGVLGTLFSNIKPL